MITWGKYYWPYFLILVSCLFLVPEIIALVTNWRNTLSQYTWKELHVDPHIHVHTIAWYISLITWLLFTIIITLHIWGGKSI